MIVRGGASAGAPGVGTPLASGLGRLLVVSSLPSTSDHLRELVRQDRAADGLAVLAHEQTAGRGRDGRPWRSPPGNLHLSVLLRRLPGPARDAAQWSLLAGVALAEAAAARDPEPRRLRLKWPNDLLRDGGKVGGILTEASLTPGGGPDSPLAWLIFGIGVNLATAPSLPDGRPTATLAVAEAPEAFALRLLARVEAWRRVQAREGFAPVRAAWQALGPDAGTPLSVRTGAAGAAERLRGRYAGLAEDGALLLAPAEGTGPVRRIATGEILVGEGRADPAEAG